MPTYNEESNIGQMIKAVSDVVSGDKNNEYTLLVVDGNSTDKTQSIVKENITKYKFVELLPEVQKSGLGGAYVYGFRHAMNDLQADVVIEMDADFQHDPKDILRLVGEITNGYDYVIGSRFVKGGSIPKEWNIRRKFWSFGGNLFSKAVLGIYSVNDFTSGFKATRVKGFVDKIDLDSVLSKGFAYKIDLLYKTFKLGAKIKEVPISFGVRDRGDSKMEKNNASDSMKVVVMLRYNQNKNLFKFLIVGFVGLFVDTGLFNLLRLTSLGSGMAPIVSGFVAMLTTFILNNYWSFTERKIEGLNKKIIGFLVYAISSMIPIFVRSQIVHVATSAMGDTFLVSNTAFFIGIVFGLVWNFTVYSKIIWRKGKNA